MLAKNPTNNAVNTPALRITRVIVGVQISRSSLANSRAVVSTGSVTKPLKYAAPRVVVVSSPPSASSLDARATPTRTVVVALERVHLERAAHRVTVARASVMV